MHTLAVVLVGLVALLHAGFLVLEMFLWKTPTGRRVFGLPPDVMAASAPLAANQGLYNGFLAAGLLWSLLRRDPDDARACARFFLACVVVAGVFGGLTAKPSIMVVQALPALIAFGLTFLAPAKPTR